MKEHQLSLSSAILLNINIMVGSGILIGPRILAGISGNASFLVWPIIAIILLPIILSTVQLSRLFPGSGGFYSYIKAGLNRKFGFIGNWLYLVGYTFSVAVDLLALRKIIAVTIGDTFLTNSQVIFNLFALTAYIGLNLLSLKVISNFLNSLTIFKLIPLISLILLIPFFFTSNFSITSTELSYLPYSFPMAIFSYFGFEYCANLSHLIKDSERNGPLAITIGFGITTVLYTLFNFGVLNLMGSANLVAYGAPDFARFLQVPIPYLQKILVFLIPITTILAIVASSNAVINANAIMLQTLADKKLVRFSNIFSKLNIYKRPWVSVLAQATVIFLLSTFIQHIDIMSSICNISVFIAFSLAFISLFLVKKRSGDTSGYFIPSLAIILSIGLVIYSWYVLGNNFTERFLYSSPILAVIIIGLILFNNKIELEEENLTI